MRWRLVAFAAAAVVAAVAWERVRAAQARRIYPPPGRLVQVGGRRLHLVHIPHDRDPVPTVVLESGIAATSISWTRVQREIAAFASVCSYDRAGYGWSDPLPGPRTPAALAKELHELLRAGGIPGPSVIVAHSFGSFIARAFAHRWPNEIAGLVFVDPIDPDTWLRMTPGERRRLLGGVFFSRLGGVLARLGIVRLLLGWLMGTRPHATARAIRVFGPEVASTLRHIVGEVQKLPPEVLPAVAAHWCKPRGFTVMAAYLSSLPASAAEIAALGSPRDLRLCVVAAGDATPEHLDRLAHLAASSSRGVLEVAEGSGHWVHLDRPDVVTAAVRRVVDEWRHEQTR